jgi:hypothetical protein
MKYLMDLFNVLLNHGNGLSTEILQKILGLIIVKLRVLDLDHNHVFVIPRSPEIRMLENRVIVPGQTVQKKHAEKGSECGK